MADIVDAFVVQLGLDPSNYQREIKNYRDDRKRLAEEDARANRVTEDAQKRQIAGFKQMRNEAVGFLTVLAGANTLRGFAQNILEGDAATGRFAANMGVATERLGAWEEAVKRAGGTAQEGRALVGTMSSAFQSLQLTGTSGNDADFQGLGVTAKDLRNPDDALLKIAEASQRMPRAEFTARLQRLGVSEAGITLLSKGRGELEKLLVQMEKQGVASKQSAEDAIAFDNALNDIEQTIKGKARPAIASLAGALAEAAEDQETLNVVSNIAVGVLGAVALATVAATWPWIALAGAIAGAVAAYQSWNNRPPDQTTGEWAADKLRFGAQWAADKLGIVTTNGGEGRLAFYNRGRDAMGNPIAGGGGASGGKASGPRSAATVEQFFKAKGYSAEQARGIAAAVVAEGGLTSRTGGGYKGRALGIGQLLGDRRQRFLDKYGPNFTLQDELEFMHWELQGGDHGGAAVRAQKTSAGTLNAMVNSFYRPAQGSQTVGDMRRGMAYLNGRATGGGTTTVNNNTTVGQVTVYTAAKDADGIAKDMRGAIAKRGLVTQANSGLTG